MNRIYTIEVFDYKNGKVLGYPTPAGWEATLENAIQKLTHNIYDLRSDGNYGFIRMIPSGIYATSSIASQIYKYNEEADMFEPTDEITPDDLPDTIKYF